MTKVVVIGIFLLSLTSWPLSVALNKLDLMKNQRIVVISGAACLLGALIGTFLLFRRYFKRVDPMMYVFSLFCFDASISLFTALELDGYIPKFKLSHYSNVTDVEPYLKTAHGTMISYWNGTVHFILCLAAIALYTRRDSHREVSLYWAGSLLNSMLVLLPAVITGEDSLQIPTLFNIIFLLLAIFTIFYYGDKRPVQARTFLKFSPIWKRPVELFFLLYFCMAIDVSVFRGLAALGGKPSCMKEYLKIYEPYLNDPSYFPKFQAITYDYLFNVYYLLAAYGLICPGQHWMADFSLIHAGAAAQAQFSYISGSLHHKTRNNFRSPQAGNPAICFWTVNLAMFVVPHLFAWWCQRDPENYGRTYTVDLATPIQTYTMSSPRRSVRLSKKAE